MIRLLSALLFVTLFSLAGCAIKGDPRHDASQKSFLPKPGVAGIYVYRNQHFAWPYGLDVELNGMPLGQTRGMTYLYAEVPPGRHVITSKAENNDSIEINAVAGRLYFIHQDLSIGFFYLPRAHLKMVDMFKGQAGVRECEFAESTVYGVEPSSFTIPLQ